MYGKMLVAGLAAAAPLVSGHEHHAHEARADTFKYSPRNLATARIPRPRLAPLKGRDTSTVPRPEFGSVPYGVDLTKCVVDGKWALSFDDGPSEYTHTLLDVLAKNGVKATFFVVGTMAQSFPEIVKREYAEGHQIGSHSWSHQDLEASTETVRQSEVLMNEQSFIDILGFFPTYFRPPYTSCGPNCLRVLGQWGYHVVSCHQWSQWQLPSQE
jgi:peptidoglycan/xylan/chitin deacetylase (PgdA/CDA1 family)